MLYSAAAPKPFTNRSEMSLSIQQLAALVLALSDDSDDCVFCTELTVTGHQAILIQYSISSSKLTKVKLDTFYP